MNEHENRLRDFGRSLGEFLSRLIIPEAGIPRPIISLKSAMPLLLPVNQDTVEELRQFVKDHRKEFRSALLVLHVQGYNDPYHRQTLTVAHPYQELATGETITRIDDPRPVKLARLVLREVPSEWRSVKPLELLLQAQARHVRHGVALGVGPTVPLRVPRQEIPGKATGI
ncbi:MAG: hypothetical protein G01um101438_262 [Parcubacteria group bacterium Gr01-1014_38]|nr:MAG: hypothetical protein G01um101438_262 [Parcubacteria group bacterium Gr01-1014_38]